MSQFILLWQLSPVQTLISESRSLNDMRAASSIINAMVALGYRSLAQAGLEKVEHMPNKIKCFFDDSNKAQKAAEAATIDVKSAWEGYVNDVIENDFSYLNSDDKVLTNFREVANNYWDFNWIVVKKECYQGNEIAQLKRSQFSSSMQSRQQSVRCHLLNNCFCLSLSPTREDAKLFWREHRKRSVMPQHVIHDDEYLSPIAYLRRRFVSFASANAKTSKNAFLHSVSVHRYSPALPDIAALPYVRSCLNHANDSELTKLSAMRPLLEGNTNDGEGIAGLGAIFNERLSLGAKTNNKSDNHALLEVLKNIERDKSLPEPDPFYALIQLDGDNVGAIDSLLTEETQPRFYQAFSDFYQRAKELIYSDGGFMIYLGGDDLRAIVPINRALICADNLCKAYLKYIGENEVISQHNIRVTVSCSVVITHIKYPLRYVITHCQSSLKKAKSFTNHSAIVIKAMDRSNIALDYAVKLRNNEESAMKERLLTIRKLIALPDFSKSLIFKLRSIIADTSQLEVAKSARRRLLLQLAVFKSGAIGLNDADKKSDAEKLVLELEKLVGSNFYQQDEEQWKQTLSLIKFLMHHPLMLPGENADDA